MIQTLNNYDCNTNGLKIIELQDAMSRLLARVSNLENVIGNKNSQSNNITFYIDGAKQNEKNASNQTATPPEQSISSESKPKKDCQKPHDTYKDLANSSSSIVGSKTANTRKNRDGSNVDKFESTMTSRDNIKREHDKESENVKIENEITILDEVPQNSVLCSTSNSDSQSRSINSEQHVFDKSENKTLESKDSYTGPFLHLKKQAELFNAYEETRYYPSKHHNDSSKSTEYDRVSSDPENEHDSGYRRETERSRSGFNELRLDSRHNPIGWQEPSGTEHSYGAPTLKRKDTSNVTFTEKESRKISNEITLKRDYGIRTRTHCYRCGSRDGHESRNCNKSQDKFCKTCRGPFHISQSSSGNSHENDRKLCFKCSPRRERSRSLSRSSKTRRDDGYKSERRK